MLCFSPGRRITANEALMHPYFADYYSDQPSGGSGGDADTSGNSSSSLANRSMRSEDVSFSSHDESGGSLGGSGMGPPMGGPPLMIFDHVF